MKKTTKILMTIILTACVAVSAVACTVNSDDIDYSRVVSIEVDETSISDGFFVSEFDISKVLLNVTYNDTVDELGATVPGEVVQMPAKLNMVKAEDKAKLSVAGTHTITLIYRRFTITFELVLRDEVAGGYRVVFLDSDGNRLGDPQNIAAGGRAVQPALPTKEGYTFIGWRDRDTGLMSTFDNVSKDLTLEAVYAPDAYKVGFYTKINGEEELISEVNVPRGANAYDYAPDIPVKVGHSNGRWADVDSMKNINSDGLKFFAVYDADQVQATFRYMRYGTAYSDHKVYCDVGEEIKNPPEAARDGYKFVEWRVNGKRVDFPYKITTEITFEAVYVSVSAGNDGLSYGRTVDGVVVSGYDGEEDIVVIPEDVLFEGETCRVVGITDGVFKDKQIKEYAVSADNEYFITIDGVLYNKSATVLYAYPSTKSGDSCVLPDTVKEISAYAFYGADELTSIKLNDALVTIGDYAFAECHSLAQLAFNKSLVTIGEGAFSVSDGAGSLTTIDFDGAFALEEIKAKAFYGANSLTDLALPSSLTTIGEAAFGGCKALRGVTALNNQYFTVYEGGLYDVNYTTLYLYPAMYGADSAAGYGSTFSPQIVLNENCEAIKSGAFSYARISSIVLNGETIVIEDGAFDCPTLRQVFLNTKTASITLGSFGDFVPEIVINQDRTVETTREAIKAAFGTLASEISQQAWEEQKKTRDYENDFIFEVYEYTDYDDGSTVIRSGIRILGARLADEDLYIPSTISSISVTEIADYAFYGDDCVVNLYLPSDLKKIGERAFSHMSKLTEVYFNDTVCYVGDYAFADSPLLSEVSGGSGMTDVEYFGKAAFDGTAFIQNTDKDFITVGCVLVKFVGFDTEVTVPAGIEFIAADSFVNHGEITELTFEGATVKVIDSNAFQLCNGITEINLPSSVRKVGKNAFIDCEKLRLAAFAVASSNKELVVEDGAFGANVVVTYGDSTQYTLTFRIDASDSYQVRGQVVVSPHEVDNTSRLRFAGWFEDEAYTVPATFPMELTDDKIVYAKWISVGTSSTGIVYRLTEDDTYVVVGYEGTDKYVIVPDTYMGKKVQAIDEGAFYGKDIVYIELPNTKNYDGAVTSNLTEIGEDAFTDTIWYDNYNGDFVVIDDFLIRYKGSASYVEIPSGIRKIAKGAFKNNRYIECVVLPDNISEIDEEVFYGCTGLKKVVLSNALLSIGYKAFFGCDRLAEINFDDCASLSSIAYDAFDGTAWLEDCSDPCVMIRDTLYKYNGSNKNATSLHIYNGVVNIGERAFENNTSLTKVYIPQSVVNIGISAFENSKVQEIVLYAGGSKLAYIQQNAFKDARYLSVIDFTLAKSLSYIGDYAFAGCTMLKSIELPAALEETGDYVFAESGLNTVIFAKGSKLERLSDYAFSNCASLSEVSFSGNSALEEIGAYAFCGCLSLTYFNNSDGVLHTIGDHAFDGCSSIKTFYVNEDTLTYIGNNALDGVGYATGDAGFVMLGNILIEYQGYDTYIEIPDNVTTIYNSAFEGNSRIKSVTFGQNSAIKNINSRAFYDCGELAEINFPATIAFVGDEVVTGTKWYENKIREGEEFITIANTLIKYNNSTIKRVYIPETVQIINDGAFDGAAVFDVAIGSGVLSIEDGAFSGMDVSKFSDWTITILGDTPPVIKESSLLSATNIIIPSQEQIDLYRLDDGWYVQYDLVKVITRYNVTYVVKEAEGYPVAEDNLYALYEEKSVETKTDGERSYIFAGWFFDESYTTAVPYPYVLSSDITLFAKCIDNTVGSNGDSYQTAASDDGKVIELYLGEQDSKIVIINSQGGEDITTIGSGWIRDEQNGTHTRNDDEYVEDKVNGTYRKVGAFEDHTELGEVYFAIGSKISVIGKDAFKGCSNLTKIVLPAGIKSIESGAFENCTSLKEVVFTGDCDGLVIATGAFKNCSALETITLPAGIKVIGDKAFEGCYNLKDIYAEGEIAVSIGREELPFEIVEGLRIHIAEESLSSYSATWAAYSDYLVTDNNKTEE